MGKMNSLRVAMAIVETASSEIQILMGKGLVRIEKIPLEDGSENYFVRLPERLEQIPYGRLLLLQIEVGLGLELVLKILIQDFTDCHHIHSLKNLYRQLDDDWAQEIDRCYKRCQMYDSGRYPIIKGPERLKQKHYFLKAPNPPGTAEDYFFWCDNHKLFTSRYEYLELHKTGTRFVILPLRAIEFLRALVKSDKILTHCGLENLGNRSGERVLRAF